MRTLKVTIQNPDLNSIQKAVDVLKNGDLVVYPTDTAYGIGANALNEGAIRKLYEIKGRDFSKPTHVVVRDWEMIEELCYTNELARKIYEAFLPGPLTMILPKKDKVSNMLVANGKTLGVRIPNNRLTMQLSSYVDFPYTTPSANRTGETTPYSIEEVEKVLDIEKIDLVLDAGILPKIAPSTVVYISEGEIKIIREGPIGREEIEKVRFTLNMKLI